MADSKTYTVEAILKATDSSFTKTMRGAMAAVNALKGGAKGTSSMFKTMFGANLASSALISGLGAAKRGISSMITELNSSNLAWKSFEGNMKILGKSDKEIAKAKASMQDYATKTIYSASDMASTYAQLASVGVKNTGKLVKGFGGLAAAAENPKQAMKTLSQQATQMAAKPKVQWQDFKLMLEQTPAGIAAVAKKMGMSTQEMVQAVQDGKISTEDFFDAIQKVGNNKSFSKMATEFKSVGQAIDGMKEGISNKLEPAFEKFNQFGIKVFKELADRMDKINFKGFAKKLGSALDGINISNIFDGVEATIGNVVSAIGKLWEGFKNTGAVTAVTNAFAHIKDAFEHVKKSLSGKGNIFKDLGKHIGDIVKWLSEATTGISNFISNMKPGTIKATAKAIGGVVLALKGLSILANLNPFTIIVSAIVGLVLAFAQAYNSSEKFRNGVDKALKILKEWGPAIAAVVGGFAIFKMLNGWNPFKGFASKGKEAFDGLKNGFTEGANSAKRSKGIIGKVFSGLGKLIESFGKFFEKFFKGFGHILEGFGKGFGKAMEGFGKGLSKVNQAQLLGLSVAIIAVGTAVLIASFGFERMAKAAATLAEAGLAAQVMFGLMLVGLVGLIAVARVFGPALSAGAVGLVAFGAAFLLVSAGIALVIAALSLLAPYIPQISEAFNSGAIAIATAMSMIISSVAEGIAIVIDAIANGVATIVESLSGLVMAFAGLIDSISGVLDSLSGVFTSVFEGIATVITAFGDTVSGILDSIGGVFEAFGESVKSVFEGAGKAIESFGKAVGTILDGIAKVIESIGNAALRAGKGFNQLADGVVKITNTKFRDMAASLAVVATEVGKIAGHSAGLAEAGSGMTRLGTGMTAVSTAATSAVSGLSAFTTKITSLSTAVSTLPAMMTTAASGFASFTAQAVSGVAGLSAINVPIAMFKAQIMTITPALLAATIGFTSFSSQAMRLGSPLGVIGGLVAALAARFNAISSASANMASNFNTASSSVDRMSSAISSGMSRATSAVRSGMSQMVSSVRSSSSQMIAAGKQAGTGVANGVTNGIRGGIGSARAAMSAMVNAIRSTGMSGAGAMRSVGAMIGQGLAQGMYSALGAVTAAANALVAQANRAAQAKAQIHSPSRLFRDEVGYWIGAGIAVGIDKSADLAVDSISDMYDDIQSVSYKANRLLDTGFSYQLSGSYGGTMQVENPSQNKMILGLLDQLNRSLDRDIVVSVNDREIARATGDAIHNYNLKKESAMRRMRGEI